MNVVCIVPDSSGGVFTYHSNVQKILDHNNIASKVIVLKECTSGIIEWPGECDCLIEYSRIGNKYCYFRGVKDAVVDASDVLLIHSADYLNVPGLYGLPNPVIYIHQDSLERKAEIASRYIGRISKVLVSSDEMKKHLEQVYKFPPNKVVTVGLPVFDRNTEPVIRKDRSGILVVGRVEVEKGSNLLLELSAELDRLGITDFINVVGKLSRNICLNMNNRGRKLVFHGELNRQRLQEMYAENRLLLILSKRETGPYVLLEAMKSGVVPVAPKINRSIISDVVISGRNGVLFSGYSIGEIVEAIKKGLELTQQSCIESSLYYDYARYTARYQYVEVFDCVKSCVNWRNKYQGVTILNNPIIPDIVSRAIRKYVYMIAQCINLL